MSPSINLRDVVAAGAILLVAVVLAFTGITQSLGAHPWWAQSVVWIGAPVGIVIALALVALRTPKWISTLVLASFSAAAFGLASSGKARFAASFAEDQFAGQMWYFGWIATAVFATATATRAISR